MRRPRQRLTGCSLVAVLTLALLACKERRRDSASAIAEVPRPAQPTGTPAPLEPRPEAPLAATALDSAAVDSGAADSGAPDTPAPRMAPPAPIPITTAVGQAGKPALVPIPVGLASALLEARRAASTAIAIDARRRISVWKQSALGCLRGLLDTPWRCQAGGAAGNRAGSPRPLFDDSVTGRSRPAALWRQRSLERNRDRVRVAFRNRVHASQLRHNAMTQPREFRNLARGRGRATRQTRAPVRIRPAKE